MSEYSRAADHLEDAWPRILPDGDRHHRIGLDWTPGDAVEVSAAHVLDHGWTVGAYVRRDLDEDVTLAGVRVERQW